jgi:L-cysteine:1D-myo-inositol 2-amino-2-deoxy-alpha-D-glucopyranoside ligase
MIALARASEGDTDDSRRRDPLDFILWRPSKTDEPKMPSPWGEGLPGWHLECSAMALKYLGSPIDIHGGGSDLIFPHHESEIAQSEGATEERPFARFWLHTGMVYLDGEKMSKSLGNMVFARDLLRAYGSNALRLYLSSNHYRAQLDYDQASLEQAANLARNLAEAAYLSGGTLPPNAELTPYRDRFVDRLNEDLDTPGAIDVLRELADTIRTMHADGRDVTAAQHLLHELGGVLGLQLTRSE